MAIFCAQCGKESATDARFCSACGRPLTPEAAAYAPAAGSVFSTSAFRTLVRPRQGRKISGVCQGLANHYAWDVTVVRIVMVLLAVLAFPIGLIVYCAIALIAPEEALTLPSTTYVSHS